MQCKARLNLITGHERVVASTRKKDPSSARATYYLAASRILPTRFSRVTGYCCKRQWPSDACNRFWASLDHRCRQSAPALFFLAPLSNATERLATKRLRQVYVRERNCWQLRCVVFSFFSTLENFTRTKCSPFFWNEFSSTRFAAFDRHVRSFRWYYIHSLSAGIDKVFRKFWKVTIFKVSRILFLRSVKSCRPLDSIWSASQSFC